MMLLLFYITFNSCFYFILRFIITCKCANKLRWVYWFSFLKNQRFVSITGTVAWKSYYGLGSCSRKQDTSTGTQRATSAWKTNRLRLDVSCLCDATQPKMHCSNLSYLACRQRKRVHFSEQYFYYIINSFLNVSFKLQTSLAN